MKTNSHQEISRQYTDEEIRQEIIEQAKKDLEELNPSFLIGCSPTGDIPKPDENIRFGDLPLWEQAAFKEALEAQARGEFVKYTFK
jgi:hypothetical protein